MKRLFIIFLICFPVGLLVHRAYSQRVFPFPLSQVTLSDGSKWRNNQQLDSSWIASLTTKRLLHNFRTTAGVFSAYEGGYSGRQKVEKLGGWESMDCDLRGHAVGHLLSAYALMANALPSVKGREEMRIKGDSIVQGLRACQQMIGTGYVSAFPEGLINRNIAGQSVWAPWYTLHKLLAGLLMQYSLCGNDTALIICRDFADWAYRKLSVINRNQRILMLRNEFGGIGESFYDLFLITKNKKHLWLSNFFYHNEIIDPLYEGNFDMKTMHCNTLLPKVIAEVKKSSNGLKMGTKFWHSLVENHVFAPGCLSDKEHFFPPEKMSKHLTGNTGETCCTYNLLRLTRELYGYNPYDVAYFDYYERALYNHILGQQDPETGMVHYFLPTMTGAYKLYSTYDQSFWCCVGSSFESHAKYGESIYWHTQNMDTVFVNLFIPSQLQAKGIRLKLNTDFPLSDQVCITIHTDHPLVLMLRHPSWTGKSGYMSYKIKKGESRIAMTLPMNLHTERIKGDKMRLALFYGPILLAGQLGTENMNCWSNPHKHNDYYGYDYQVPASITNVGLRVNKLKRVGFLEWETDDHIKIKPLYDTHRQRYVIYWYQAD